MMILRADSLSKRYMRKSASSNTFLAVQTCSIALRAGTVTVLMGRSGSGKTTLLNMLAGLLQPTEGQVYLDDQSLYGMNDALLSRVRNEHISFVPQGRSAVDSLTVRENIMLPCALYGRTCREQADHWLEELGIADLADVRTSELSGGELRRMAIARALTQDGEILLADEPTGDLDDGNTDIVLRLLKDVAHKQNKAVMIVSHESIAVEYADQLFMMNMGELKPFAAAPVQA